MIFSSEKNKKHLVMDFFLDLIFFQHHHYHVTLTCLTIIAQWHANSDALKPVNILLSFAASVEKLSSIFLTSPPPVSC